jgi:hypothetical protein
MTTADYLAGNLSRNLELLKQTLADFSDAEMLVRPVPAANHATWQLGHLISAETQMGNAVRPGSMPALPTGFAEKFNGKTISVDDPKALASKEQLLSLFTSARQASVKWVKSLSPQDLEAAGPERMRAMAPTVGDVAGMLMGHTTMHVGQFQVIRRKLGKPILF